MDIPTGRCLLWILRIRKAIWLQWILPSLHLWISWISLQQFLLWTLRSNRQTLGTILD